MASVALASSLIATGDAHISSLHGGQLKLTKKSPLIFSSPNKLPTLYKRSKKLVFHKNKASVQASYSGRDGRPSSASIFVGGFVLGGAIVGALGCVFAPQISKALAGADRKDLMRRLPKFICDEEKALEKTRKVLAQKIAQLNDAIDDVSSQLRSDSADSGPNAVAVEELEASI